jgi:XTP/dITP diphosphohydrolase
VKRLVVATTNAGKVREVQAALSEASGFAGWSVEPLPPGIPEIEETGVTFLDNAILKAVHYSRFVDALTLADDSGLSVTVLGGRPGLHSARYAPTTEERNRNVIAELDALGSNADRSATFFCALALAQSGQPGWSVNCQIAGKITRQPCGSGGFGYDPIFFIPDVGKTMAELTTEEKNRISARGKALAELRKELGGEKNPEFRIQNSE